mmetsp:Transcript_24999/g.60919  ORF Transcript_24999/g.60919 Transcript_24999/m.60919 type:complete len:115 (+) Transcript_24999:171-515(+)|eukprot:CAMPEP_0198308460 /NCGR_PEP_ID=MMETSP1450-20131203/1103_1 /TAXON_ID=753684 ORGANISM="Madagascaria erythrocladiodes, Strain CCMP3234" /NCGR_SAMPLE_ID=MMETSP1450 /ASSEMBLY_ACC=CAM_ASM_001115 /LENGTH=114 /DNA_ID=CAMNT_0044011127 /DNA_START=171 /DNA_END=515 /DNA_ORIENTATION=+
MGLLNSRAVWYYLEPQGKREPYLKFGPYTFSSIAQMWREETIDGDTLVWTNEKLPTDENPKKKKYVEGWVKIKEMGAEFRSQLEMTARSLPDRRQPVQTVVHEGAPPPMVPQYH